MGGYRSPRGNVNNGFGDAVRVECFGDESVCSGPAGAGDVGGIGVEREQCHPSNVGSGDQCPDFNGEPDASVAVEQGYADGTVDDGPPMTTRSQTTSCSGCVSNRRTMPEDDKAEPNGSGETSLRAATKSPRHAARCFSNRRAAHAQATGHLERLDRVRRRRP
jgi:hypothetical protein